MFRGWLIHTSHSSLACSDPHALGVIKVEGTDHSWRHSISFREVRKMTIVVSQEASVIKPYPEISSGVFSERGRCCLGYPVGGMISMKGLAAAVPPGQHCLRVAQRADPEVAVGIFKQPKYGSRRESIPLLVNRFGPRLSELRQAQPGIANETLVAGQPPFAFAVLKHDLVPAPAPA